MGSHVTKYCDRCKKNIGEDEAHIDATIWNRNGIDFPNLKELCETCSRAASRLMESFMQHDEIESQALGEATGYARAIEDVRVSLDLLRDPQKSTA